MDSFVAVSKLVNYSGKLCRAYMGHMYSHQASPHKKGNNSAVKDETTITMDLFSCVKR